ncbi:hypothetical protein R3P38DRAFT_2784547 [Favolaschia claudopus]|uniref:DUF6535 domain-containing protein n=1 Tax=Favolaschia claudopus TaxID=2862362 RepID=A0AAW0AY31_9AGAR
MCFNELIVKQEEQGERLNRAVEALKSPSPTTDKKTAFWNSYLKLADENDKAFQQKYSTDLDTALIFAGLFSAVGSVFIIQIQPQLAVSQPPRIIVLVQSMLYISLFTTLSAALLAVLGKQWMMYYQAAGSRGTFEERGLERQRKLDGLVKWKFDVLLQMFPLLLQLSLLLFSASLTIYLWTQNHCVAMIVMFMTSFGVASYLLLLISATIFPDCPFQTPLAPILNRIASPYVSSLWLLLCDSQNKFKELWTFIVRTRDVVFPHFVSTLLPASQSTPRSRDKFADADFTPPSPEVPAVLWVLGTSTDPAMISTAAEMAIDLQWPLALDLGSTEAVLTRLAEIIHSCFDFRHTTLATKLRKNMAQLAITCGRLYCSLRLVARASGINPESALQHRLLLDLYIETEFGTDNPELENVIYMLKGRPHLVNGQDALSMGIGWVLHVIPSLKSISFQAKAEQLVDHIQEDMPSLNLPSFTNYLCCLNSLFAPTNPRVMIEMDKTPFRSVLMNQLFDAFLDSILVVDISVIARIIETTAQLTNQLVGPTRTSYRDDYVLVQAISRFCSTFPRIDGWLDVVVAASKLLRVDQATDLLEIHLIAAPSILTTSTEHDAVDVTWIYWAMEQLEQSWRDTQCDASSQNWDEETVDSIGSLLRILACSGILPTSPSPESFRIILRALSASSDKGVRAGEAGTPAREGGTPLSSDIAFTAFLVLKQGQNWFMDPSLRSLIEDFSMLSHLGRVVLDCKHSFPYHDFLHVMRPYMKLLKGISDKPESKSLLPLTELPTWMAIFSDDTFHGRMKALTSVIRNVWVPKLDKQFQFTYESEECLAFALTALSNAWNTYDFSSTCAEKFWSLARCTVSTTLYFETRWNHLEVTYYSTQGLPPALMTISASRMRESLLKASVNSRNTTPTCASHTEQSLKQMSELLESLADSMGTIFAPGLPKMQVKGRDHDVWWEVRRNLEGWIDIERSICGEDEVHHSTSCTDSGEYTSSTYEGPPDRKQGW